MKLLRSLRVKLVGMVLLTTFCALIVAGAAILALDINGFRSQRIGDMSTQIELLALASAPALQFEDHAVANQNLALLSIRPTVSEAAIYDARGGLFASYRRTDNDSALPALPEREGVTIIGDEMVIFRRIVQDGEILGSAYLRADILLYDRIIGYLSILGVVALGAMGVAVLVSAWLQSFVTRPILSIARISRGVVRSREYSYRAEKLSNDEVGLLVEAFNDMLDEIEARTRALEQTNSELQQESAERKRAREEVLRLNEVLERKVLERTRQLELSNQELESFCSSVSHDLRAPLRAISGFSDALIEELPKELPGNARRYLERIIAASLRMGQLIEDLLNLSRVSRGELRRDRVDFSALARDVVEDLRERDPQRVVEVSVWDNMEVEADPKLLRIVLENLLGNAWKFTSRKDDARLEVGSVRDGEREVYFVRDNGVGFDMRYADKLFGAFQRLHGMTEYPGTGIGLATVERIVHRHGGRVWADATVGKGATFYFTLRADLSESPEAASEARGTSDPQTL